MKKEQWSDVIWWIRCNVLNAGVITLALIIALASLQSPAGLVIMTTIVVALKRVIDKERDEAFSKAQGHEELRRLRNENFRLMLKKPETNNKEEESYW